MILEIHIQAKIITQTKKNKGKISNQIMEMLLLKNMIIITTIIMEKIKIVKTITITTEIIEVVIVSLILNLMGLLKQKVF